MTSRSAVFTGTAGAAWPALSSGDTWSTSGWHSPTVDPAQIEAAMSATVSGTTTGLMRATHNRAPYMPISTAVLSTTAASSAGKYTASGATAHSTAGGYVNLLFVSTTAVYAHTHVITPATCTGSWATMTFDEVATFQYFASSTSSYNRMTVYRTTVASSSTGNLVLSIIDTATGLAPATQATGCVIYVNALYGSDTSSNGVNAIRATAGQIVTATSTTGQPAVTLGSNMLRYSSLPVLFCTHATNNAAANSGDSGVVNYSGYGTPANGTALYVRTLPATVATIKTQRTMTAAFAAAITPWGAIGFELLDADTSDSYTDYTRDYTFMRLASNAVRPAYRTAEIRTSSNWQEFGPFPSVVGRYVESGGSKFTLYSSVTSAHLKGEGYGYIGVAIDDGTSTTYSSVAAAPLLANSDIRLMKSSAFRIRVLASGDLWVSAKWWKITEPAWPALSTDGSSQVLNDNMVVNGIYSTNDALRNATTCSTGLLYTYAASMAPGLVSNSVVGPRGGVNTVEWTTYTDDAWVVSGTATASASGSLAADASTVRLATATATATSSLTASASTVRLATATATASGSLTASATKISVATASLTSSASLAASATKINIATASASATSSLVASATAIKVATAAAVATSSLVAAASRIRLATATATASGSLTANATVITPSAQTLPVPITVSLVSGMEAALGSGMLASLPNAPFEAALRLHL